jgi:hypothetical protein
MKNLFNLKKAHVLIGFIILLGIVVITMLLSEGKIGIPERCYQVEEDVIACDTIFSRTYWQHPERSTQIIPLYEFNPITH